MSELDEQDEERIFISNIDMNEQHKSSFYKFVGGPGGGGLKESLSLQISASGEGGWGVGWDMAPLPPPIPRSTLTNCE